MFGWIQKFEGYTVLLCTVVSSAYMLANVILFNYDEREPLDYVIIITR